jgi:hypothetical protein
LEYIVDSPGEFLAPATVISTEASTSTISTGY